MLGEKYAIVMDFYTMTGPICKKGEEFIEKTATNGYIRSFVEQTVMRWPYRSTGQSYFDATTMPECGFVTSTHQPFLMFSIVERNGQHFKDRERVMIVLDNSILNKRHDWFIENQTDEVLDVELRSDDVILPGDSLTELNGLIEMHGLVYVHFAHAVPVREATLIIPPGRSYPRMEEVARVAGMNICVSLTTCMNVPYRISNPRELIPFPPELNVIPVLDKVYFSFVINSIKRSLRLELSEKDIKAIGRDLKSTIRFVEKYYRYSP